MIAAILCPSYLCPLRLSAKAAASASRARPSTRAVARSFGLALGFLLFAPFGFPIAEVRAESAESPEPSASKAPAISVIKVTPRRLREKVIASGLIAPVEEVQVQPLIEGQPIEALLADIGDLVEAGQVLAVLSKTTLELQKAEVEASAAAARATVAQAEAQLTEAEATAAEAERVATRTKRLNAQGSASQAAAESASSAAISATARVSVARQSLEAARAQVALSEAQKANIMLQLTRTEVTAPYAGRILARNATIGAVATAAGAPMFILEKDAALELRADLTEADVLRLSPGLPAALRAIGLKAPLQGQVRLIEPAIDSATRLGRARISLAPDAPVRAGMYAEATIILAEREGLAVPISAISRNADGLDQVLSVSPEGKVEAIPVSLGISESGWIEVQKGLTPGSQVVAKAGAFVRAGDWITPVPAPDME